MNGHYSAWLGFWLSLLGLGLAWGSPKGSGSVRLLLGLPGAEFRGDCRQELCQSLLQLLSQAGERIDFAIYGLRGQPQILRALVTAQERGIPVRGVVDADAQGRNPYGNTAELKALIPGIQTDVADEQARQATDPQARARLMHHKFFVVDGCWVWTGSANISDTDLGGYNANLGVLIESCQVGAWFQAEVEQMHQGAFNQQKTQRRDPQWGVRLDPDAQVRVYFSPQDRPEAAIIREIDQDRSRMDVGMFYLTHPQIAEALIRAHRRGVTVQVITDATAASNPSSQHQRLRAAGIPVKVENWPGKMHLKAAAIDGQVLILGSMNWTLAGSRFNDENTLILRSPSLSRQAHGFLQQLWQGIPEAWLRADPRPEGADSPGSCQDGLDNDHDGLVDSRDPDCP
ncbi:MAG: phospholipase D-like domain-containing protein [Thermostichales cyanobacterium SRBZ-1_bins_19]